MKKRIINYHLREIKKHLYNFLKENKNKYEIQKIKRTKDGESEVLELLLPNNEKVEIYISFNGKTIWSSRVINIRLQKEQIQLLNSYLHNKGTKIDIEDCLKENLEEVIIDIKEEQQKKQINI